jgi:hypothetical protein
VVVVLVLVEVVVVCAFAATDKPANAKTNVAIFNVLLMIYIVLDECVLLNTKQSKARNRIQFFIVLS